MDDGKRNPHVKPHHQPCCAATAQEELEKFVKLAIALHFHVGHMHKPSFRELNRKGYMSLDEFEGELFHFIVNAARATQDDGAESANPPAKPVFPLSMPSEFARKKGTVIGRGYADWAVLALGRIHLYDAPAVSPHRPQ